MHSPSIEYSGLFGYNYEWLLWRNWFQCISASQFLQFGKNSIYYNNLFLNNLYSYYNCILPFILPLHTNDHPVIYGLEPSSYNSLS